MRLFRPKPAAEPSFDAPIAPDLPFYAVGDIHGCDQLLESLFDRFAADAHPTAQLICVGDFIDRGEQSAQVLSRLYEMQLGAGGMMTCLMGNHERMLLDFLDNPEKNGVRWVRNGGLQTLASYRVTPVAETAEPYQWEHMRDELREKMGEGIEAWLRDLPLFWKSGNVVVTHAGADPRKPIEEQGEKALVWGRSPFLEQLRDDGLWIAHGHVIKREPKAELGRISLDTGAYATGRLTAALVERGKVTYISA